MRNKKIGWLVKVAMLSAVATVLMLFEFPLPFLAPPFYELDFSELPVLIGAFSLGPIAGIFIELIKVLLNLVINGTITAGVGELANFLMGISYVIPAALIYNHRKCKKNAVLGLLVGSISMVIFSCMINAYILIPAYGTALNIPMDAFVGMGNAIFPIVDNLTKLVLFCVAPFNLVKAILVSVLTLILYKKISPVLHK